MKASIQRLFILASLATGLLSLSGAAAALEFECSLPGDIRFLRVDVPGEIHLCEVSVTSQLSNERRVMWYADNDTQFCSAKVYELRDRYVEEFSFTCKEGEDRDGIDRLSPRHRTILDGQLKALLTSAAATTNDSTAPGSAVDTDEGDAALASSEDENARETPPVLAVRTVRAVASSPCPGPAACWHCNSS